MERFVCVNGSDNLQIPDSLTEEMGIVVPEQLHYHAESISKIAASMSGGGWVRLPFCSTLCSEALGCKPVLSLSGARVREPAYQKPEELPECICGDTVRLEAMFCAVNTLASERNNVVYQIEGPFTLLCALLPMNRVFSALRKPAGQQMLQTAENWVSQYTALAAARGIRCISFADPVATIDILGERIFKSVYIPSLKRILTRLQEENPNIPIHLCGKLTQCLLDIDCCEVEKWYPENCEKYGQALEAYQKTGYGGLVGHFCLNYLDAKRPYLKIIKMK